MKIIVDMNLSPKLADKLVQKGIEAKHWIDIGTPDAKDEDIMTFARNNDYIILTCDLDFSTILSVLHGKKPSVIQLRMQATDYEQLAYLIYNAVSQNTNELEKGAVLTINPQKARLRVLPII